MSVQNQTSEGTAMGTQAPGGATPPEPPTDGTATGSQSPAPVEPGTRDANRPDNPDGEETRDANLTGSQLEKALKEERRRNRAIEAELRQLREAEQQRADAEKSELQLASERAEAAERRVAEMERETLARQVAGEAGIPTLWHRLSGADTRALRADAQRLREEMGLTTGALEGGVRSDGVPAQPESMDDLIRGFGAGRR